MRRPSPTRETTAAPRHGRTPVGRGTTDPTAPAPRAGAPAGHTDRQGRTPDGSVRRSRRTRNARRSSRPAGRSPWPASSGTAPAFDDLDIRVLNHNTGTLIRKLTLDYPALA